MEGVMDIDFHTSSVQEMMVHQDHCPEAAEGCDCGLCRTLLAMLMCPDLFRREHSCGGLWTENLN